MLLTKGDRGEGGLYVSSRIAFIAWVDYHFQDGSYVGVFEMTECYGNDSTMRYPMKNWMLVPCSV